MLVFVFYITVLCGIVFGNTDNKNNSLNGKESYFANLINPSEKVLKRVIKITKADGRDKNGWINMEKVAETNLKYINIELRNGKVMCNEGNSVVPIKLKNIQNVSSVGENNSYLLHVDYGSISPTAKTVNPLPLIKKGWDANCDLAVDLGFSEGEQEKSKDKIFGDNFEGYLVCYRKDDQALLVPKLFKNVNFKAPHWRVAVEISMHKNPLAAFGRQYKVTILDSVDVLENGKRSFIWPLPLRSMADVYIFHKMMEKKNKMCFLERDAKTFDINLYCEHWGFRLKRNDVNLGTLIAMGIFNVGMLAYTRSIKPYETDYWFRRNYNNNSLFTTDVFVNGPDHGSIKDRGEEVEYLEPHLRSHALRMAKKNWYFLINLVVLLAWGSSMAAWTTGLYIRLLLDIKQMDKLLDKVTFVYPWALEQSFSMRERSNLNEKLLQAKIEQKKTEQKKTA